MLPNLRVAEAFPCIAASTATRSDVLCGSAAQRHSSAEPRQAHRRGRCVLRERLRERRYGVADAKTL